MISHIETRTKKQPKRESTVHLTRDLTDVENMILEESGLEQEEISKLVDLQTKIIISQHKATTANQSKLSYQSTADKSNKELGDISDRAEHNASAADTKCSDPSPQQA